MDLTPTPSQTVGPYLDLGLTGPRSVSRMAGDAVPGKRISLTFEVLDGDGVPVPDAMIELWQADCEGRYPDSERPDAFRGFGRMPTGEDGKCSFETIIPGQVPGTSNTLQAPHINVSVMARGLLKRLSTRAYFAGEAANASDPVLALVPEHRRATLLAQPDQARAGSWFLTLKLCGENETVFFDV